jgi:hypothetical protein
MRLLMDNKTKKDFQFGRLFLPAIKKRLGYYLISEAPMEEDMKHNTDLMVLMLKPYRIACRIRTPKYYEKYPTEFTIRSDRPSGTKTELAKMLEGWGDYIFYGFGDPDTKMLIAWFIGNFNVFRAWWNQCEVKGYTPGFEMHNPDGSSSFRVFNTKEMPKDFIIGRQTPIKREVQ